MKTASVVGIMDFEHATGSALRRRQRRLRQWLRHERMTVAMALAEASHHAAPRRLKPASAITVNDAPRGQENADAEYFELRSEEESGVCEEDAAGSALGAPATGAGAAAHRGADDRVLRARADARSRRSCAADGETHGGCPEDH